MRHAAFCLAFLLLACGRTEPRSLAQTSLDADAGSGAPDACEQAIHILSGVIPAASSADNLGAAAIADQGLVLFDSRENGSGDLELFQLDPATETQTVLTHNDLDDQLIDARGGASLLFRGGLNPTLIYRDGHGEVPLDTFSGGAILGLNYDGAPIHAVEPGQAAWINGDKLMLFQGGQIRGIAPALGSESWPYLRGDQLSWSARDAAGLDLFLATGTEIIRVTHDLAEDRAPVLSGGDLYWIKDQQLMRRVGATGAIEMISAGPCDQPAEDGGRVVAACGATSEIGGRPALLYFDGQNLSTLTVSSTRRIHAPRLDPHGVTWIEYDAGDLCSGQGTGRILYQELQSTLAPWIIGKVGAPCLCCNAFWPPAALSFDAGLLTYNYAFGPAQSPPVAAAQIGYARIVRSCL